MRYTSVNVAGLHISGGTGKIVLAPPGLDGWDDGVDIRRTASDRTNAHGSHDAPGYLDSRVISIPGRVLADSAAECENIGMRITGLLAGGQAGRIAVAGETGTQWANGRLSARTRFTPDFSRRNATFQIQLWSPDPRKFGEEHTFVMNSGTAYPVFHRGNFPATPKYAITGSMPGGYTLHVMGTYFTVGHPLVTGKPHTIDFRDGRLYVGGSPVVGGVSAAGNLTQVNPGVAITAGIEPTTTGTAVATMKLLDTFI